MLLKNKTVILNDKTYGADDKMSLKTTPKTQYLKMIIKNEQKKLDSGITYYPHKIDACSERDIELNKLTSYVFNPSTQINLFADIDYNEDFKDM